MNEYFVSLLYGAIDMWKPSILLLVKVSLTIGAVWYLLESIDPRTIVEAAATLTPNMAAAALGLLVLHILICATRWTIVVRAIGGSISLFQASTLSCIGNFFNQLLPGGIGGEAVRIWKIHQAGLPFIIAFNSVA